MGKVKGSRPHPKGGTSTYPESLESRFEHEPGRGRHRRFERREAAKDVLWRGDRRRRGVEDGLERVDWRAGRKEPTRVERWKVWRAVGRRGREQAV
jgi:hypothetical protein